MSLLSRIQLNPETGTQDAGYVEDLIEGAKRWIAAYVGVPLYPELRQGYSRSAATPSTNLSALASSSFLIRVNNGAWRTVELVLASCTTGDGTATHMQAKIVAINDIGFDEVTVVYNDDETGGEYYQISSGRYGISSSIEVGFYDYAEHVVRAMKLSPTYGGTEYPGGLSVPTLDDIVVRMVARRYRQTGMEGAKSGSIDGGNSFTLNDLDPEDSAVLRDNYRRIGRRCVSV